MNEQSKERLGQPQKVKEHVYIFKDKALSGTSYLIACPDCGQEHEVHPDQKGVFKGVCPNCKCRYGFNVVELPKPKEDEDSDGVMTETDVVMVSRKKHSGGALVWGGILGGLLFRKAEHLNYGDNIVGRKDENKPSDISIDDSFVSRRSIKITVKPAPGKTGNTYRLTVLSAANPVFVNSNALETGDYTFLNYNDKIKIGHTVLTLKKLKKK